MNISVVTLKEIQSFCSCLLCCFNRDHVALMTEEACVCCMQIYVFLCIFMYAFACREQRRWFERAGWSAVVVGAGKAESFGRASPWQRPATSAAAADLIAIAVFVTQTFVIVVVVVIVIVRAQVSEAGRAASERERLCAVSSSLIPPPAPAAAAAAAGWLHSQVCWNSDVSELQFF